MVDAIGWLSSFVLVLTLANQVLTQWRSGTSRGVSKWLFVGQITASVGFTTYSWLVHNWVFVVTNGILLVNAVIGLAIVERHRRGERRRDVAERRLAPSRRTVERQRWTALQVTRRGAFRASP